MARKRGGARTPTNPAPVSGPGALSQRTDGGPGQPVRSFPAEFHGQRQALADLQSAAPLAVAPAPSGNATAQGGALPSADVFAPTDRPTEPMTQGATPFSMMGDGPGPLPDDPDLLLRMIYNQYPHPAIARLIRG